MRRGFLRTKKFIAPKNANEKLSLIEQLSKSVLSDPLTQCFDSIVNSNRKIILCGESSHGTHENYYFRAELAKKLITAGKCNAILIEADFPDTADVHRYIMGENSMSLDDVLDGYERFPSWMWGNAVFKMFITWLRSYNNSITCPQKRVGIFGLDIYSLHKSISKVLEYLKEHDQEMEAQVKHDYSCFGEIDPQTLGFLSERGLIRGCKEAATSVLKKIESKTPEYASSDPVNGLIALDNAFINEQNARVVVGATDYYQCLFNPNKSSWNIRDKHFFDTLKMVRQHLNCTRKDKNGKDSNQVMVWAHNSHVGDARATHLELKPSQRELNIGELVKENYPNECIIVGQLFYRGTVTAADNWGQPHEYKQVRDALEDSYEDVLHMVSHSTGLSEFYLNLNSEKLPAALLNSLQTPRLQRAIGVIYRPDTERQSHYYFCNIVQQFDRIVWCDSTTPVAALTDVEIESEEAETYPTGY